jgi:hypothetical protein
MLDGWAMVLGTAKPADTEDILTLAEEAGRLGDVYRLSENPVDILATELKYGSQTALGAMEATRPAAEVLGRGQGAQGGNSADSAFFNNGSDDDTIKAFQLLMLARETPTATNTRLLVDTAPRTEEEAKSAGWQEKAYCGRLIRRVLDREDLTPDESYLRELVVGHWCISRPRVSPKTLGIFTQITANRLRPLVEPPLRGLLGNGQARDLNKWWQDGTILVIDTPALLCPEHAACNALVRALVQRVAMRRLVDDYTRPLLLVFDEAQASIVTSDINSAAVSRSQLFSACFATQGFPVLASAFGAAHGLDMANALAANLTVTFWHASRCSVSLKIAQESLGKQLRVLRRGNASLRDGQVSPDAGWNQHLESPLAEGTIQRLRTGGPRNGCMVDAVVTQVGRVWDFNGAHWLLTSFAQGA